MNTPIYPPVLAGWQESQVSEQVVCCLWLLTVTFKLDPAQDRQGNLAAVVAMSDTGFYLWMIPSALN